MGTEAALPGNYNEVFLSFRGADTRKTFTDFLFHLLDTKGVKTFIDNRGLTLGEELDTSLPKAIAESRIWIVIFSKRYASSKWCLNELAEIVKCSKKDRDKAIIPIFYDVTPSDVKHQERTFREAFDEHKVKGVESETLEKWRAALKHVAELSGKERDETADGTEGELALLIVNDVLGKLRKYDQHMPRHVVGIEPHIEEVVKLLDISDSNPRTVVIHGMCGIGKTTISKAVYNKLWKYYECPCFLENIRHTERQTDGNIELQKQLIMQGLCWEKEQANQSCNLAEDIRLRFREKKALIVLDGVETAKGLIVECECLGPGSRIIVTTINKGLLREVPCYETPQMEQGELSVELFAKYAFKDGKVPEEWRDISKKVAQIASGLPLSLKMMGKHFRLLRRGTWEDTCRKLEKTPDMNVIKRLEAIYKELGDDQKQIFLDIACLLIGVDQRIAWHMWKALEFNPITDLEELRLLFSLVKIGNDNVLDMHRQLRDFGRYIVRVGPEKGSRQWSHVEALKTLTRNFDQEKNSVLALCLKFPSGDGEPLEKAAFKKLYNLYYLELDSAKLQDGNKLDGNPESHCDLKWLCWKVPSSELTHTNFRLDALVILDLSNSNISKEWEGWPHIKKAKRLRVLNLKGCDRLEQTPDLSAFKDLERLILEDCTNLVQISISSLGKLIYLNLKNCEKLRIHSQDLGSVETLEEIILDGTTIEELPNWSEGCRKKLRVLSAIGCEKLRKIDSIAGIRAPREELGSVEALEEIFFGGTAIEELPKWSEGCKEKLRVLSVIGCKKLTKIDSVAELKSLTVVAFDDTPIADLPESFASLSKLVNLSLNNCNQLKTLPDWIGSLEELRSFSLKDCGSIEAFLDVSRLTKLKAPVIEGSPGVRITSETQNNVGSGGERGWLGVFPQYKTPSPPLDVWAESGRTNGVEAAERKEKACAF